MAPLILFQRLHSMDLSRLPRQPPALLSPPQNRELLLLAGKTSTSSVNQLSRQALPPLTVSFAQCGQHNSNRRTNS
jgi:hypothetical protein